MSNKFKEYAFLLPNGAGIDDRHGMTLRDYFAAHAPASALGGNSGYTHIEDEVEYRYKYADAMLAERNKTRTE
jgi:hypothetical protein